MTTHSKPGRTTGSSYQERTLRPKSLATALALALALAAGSARAELTLESRRSAAAQAAGVGALTGTVSARCWQEGREIVAERDFTSAEIGQELKGRSLFLQSGGSVAGHSAVLLPIANALCLLTVHP